MQTAQIVEVPVFQFQEDENMKTVEVVQIISQEPVQNRIEEQFRRPYCDHAETGADHPEDR